VRSMHSLSPGPAITRFEKCGDRWATPTKGQERRCNLPRSLLPYEHQRACICYTPLLVCGGLQVDSIRMMLQHSIFSSSPLPGRLKGGELRLGASAARSVGVIWNALIKIETGTTEALLGISSSHSRGKKAGIKDTTQPFSIH